MHNFHYRSTALSLSSPYARHLVLLIDEISKNSSLKVARSLRERCFVMGKSRKNPNVEVEAAPTSVPTSKAAKKEKRGVEEAASEERARSKKQKLETEQLDNDKKKVKKLKKALIESPWENKNEGKSSDFECGFAAVPIMIPPTKAETKGKRGAEKATKKHASSKNQIIKLEKVGQSKKMVKKLKKSLIESPVEKKDETTSSDFGVEETGDERKVSLPDDAKNHEISKISDKELETPTKQNEESGTKRLFVGNLADEVIKDDLLEFFKKYGEVTEVRLAIKEDGSFRGFGHVEFATEAGARAALRMNGHMLLGRPMIVDLAREMGSNNPHEGKENRSSRIVAQDPGHSIYVKGFGKSMEEDKIRKLLNEHFGSYGEIIRVSIPQDNKTGRSKGFAYVLFNDQDSASKALELNGTELGGYSLTVQKPAPKSGPRDGSYSGGRGRGGRLAGQGGGHDRGGWGCGRGGRWAGASYNKSATMASKGKKTTFGDNE